MNVRVMSRTEVEEYDKELDQWWKDLDWNTKNRLRSLVLEIQKPIRADLPMQYAGEGR